MKRPSCGFNATYKYLWSIHYRRKFIKPIPLKIFVENIKLTLSDISIDGSIHNDTPLFIKKKSYHKLSYKKETKTKQISTTKLSHSYNISVMKNMIYQTKMSSSDI